MPAQDTPMQDIPGRDATRRKGAPDFRRLAEQAMPEGASHEDCVACGLCSSGCPASGMFGMDPRRFLRMAALGLNEELARAPWVWACTMCKRCAYLCPKGIDVSILVELARALWPEAEKPRGIVRSCAAQKRFEGASAMGLRTEDFRDIVEETREAIRAADPRFADLEVPFDKPGTHFVVNQNSREPAIEPEEMGPLWKIFHLAGADWTYASDGWSAENFCMFSGDADGWRRIVETRVAACRALGAKVWLNTECGHSFYAFWRGVERFGLEADFEVKNLTSLYAQWIREGRLKVNSSWNVKGLKFTVQDPCQLVRKSLGDEAADDLRFVVAVCAGAENFIDMAPSRSANYCCGGGGGFLQAGMSDLRRAYGRRKFDQIMAARADYVVTPCHNCHSQIEDIAAHYGGGYRTIHLWTLIGLALGILSDDERKYLGPELGGAER